MSLLQWKPEYSVGIASMDDEHRGMIGLINDVYAQLDQSADVYETEACLEEIFIAISSHFALEERLMLEAAYSEYDAHKEDHENLLDEIRDLVDEFVADPVAGGQVLEERLSIWFSKHFSTFGARLHGELGPH